MLLKLTECNANQIIYSIYIHINIYYYIKLFLKYCKNDQIVIHKII